MTEAHGVVFCAPANRSEDHGSQARQIESCRAALSRHARSFKWGSIFLPRPMRDDAAILYAFCRVVDDAVDEASDPESARSSLSRVVDSLERHSPEEPLIAVFKAMAFRRQMDLRYARHLIEGVASDLGPVRVANEDELLRYCYRVASTVGLMMSRVIEVSDRRALPHAIDLGIAMQLTNICRDVLEDARSNRVYLPEQLLGSVGSSQSRLVLMSAEPEKIAVAVRRLLALAERYYRSADAAMRYIPLRPRLAIIIAARVYRAIGRSLLRRHNGNPLFGRVVVPWYEKLFWLGISLGAWLGSFFPARIPDHDSRLHRSIKGFPEADG